MKTNRTRDEECPVCGKKIRVPGDAPVTVCPECGRKIINPAQEILHGECGGTQKQCTNNFIGDKR